MAVKKNKSEDISRKDFNPTGDDFVDACFIFNLTQKNDIRSASNTEGLKEVPGLVKENRFQEAWSILDENQDIFSDFDFIYVWQAMILQKNGQADQAKETLTDGLKHARLKHVLCDRLGQLAFETGQMETAVKWWIRSIVIMLNTHTQAMWEPFLYLAYVARACGSEKSYKTLMAKVTSISVHGELMLKKEAENQLIKNAESLPGKSVVKAVELLCTQFKNKLTPKPAPALTGSDSKKTQPSPQTDQKTMKPEIALPPNEQRQKHSRWGILLGLTMLISFLIYFFFLKPPDINPALSEVEKNTVQKSKAPLPDKVAPFTSADEKKSGLLQALSPPPEAQTQKHPPKGTQASPRLAPVPSKKRLPGLKVKAKTTHPAIKKKDG